MISRRALLQSSIFSAVGLSAINAVAQDEKQEKSCIFIYLHGGISHIDFTHPGIDIPSEYRSVKGTILTPAGYHLGGSFVNLSKLSNKISVVKSFAHRDANHSTAGGWVNTGHSMLGVSEGGPQKEPAYGSIISRVSGEMTKVGVPSYIKTSKIDFGGARRDGSAWLGSRHIGFDVDEEGIRNLQLGVSKQRGDDRMRIVEFLDSDNTQQFEKQWTELRRTSYNIAMGPAGSVFDLKLESQEAQTAFKVASNRFGKDLLTAIRSVQNGAKFVTVVNGGWDMHNDISDGFTAKGPELDWGLSLLIQELEARNLLDKTLVVITTEFGRTPKINVNSGRDHWNGLIPLVFAGGGYQHGRTIGTCNDKNESPTSETLQPKDLCRTILNHFDVKIGDKVIDNLNRPRYLIENESKNILLG